MRFISYMTMARGLNLKIIDIVYVYIDMTIREEIGGLRITQIFHSICN